MKAAAVVADILKREGTEHLFCFPIHQVIDACAELGIRPIMARTERAVVGMADGYARVTNGRKIGVCTMQYGPGTENAFGGLAQAYSDSTPILCLPGGVPETRTGVRPNFDAVLNFQHITKWVARVNRPDRIPDFLRRAFTYLRTGRPGPVTLELPWDVMLADVEQAGSAYTPVKGTRTMADPGDVAAAARAMVAARSPLIHAGLGVLYAEASAELVELAELLQAPAMTTLSGKSAFPEDHPLAIGSGGLAWPRAVTHFLAEADLVFGAGASLSISSFAAPIPKGKVGVQLTVDDRDLNKDYAAQHLLMGDAKLVLGQVIEEIKRLLGPDGRRGDDRTVKQVRTVKNTWLAEWMPRLISDEVPINPYRVIWDLQQALAGERVIVTHDAGNPRDQLSPFWIAREPNSYIGWGRSTHLGYSLPLALGAKVALPDRTVVHVLGDAAFGQCGMDIETAVRNRIGVVTVLLNNACLGGYDKHIPIATKLYRTRFLSGDYAKVAEGLGAYAEKVEKPAEIIPAVQRAVDVAKGGRPAVLEVITKEDPVFSK
jgi:thiamine pyrophosphate-dependent acetolactate synthase large subunit-like protein